MTISGMHRRLLLGSGLALSGLLGYGRSADAACVVTVSPNYLCSGTEATTQSILNIDNAAVTTAADFSVNAAAGNGIEISGDGAISFTDVHAAGDRSIITGINSGLYIRGTGAGTAAPDSVTVNSNGTITGGQRGIRARNSGTGALSVTTGAGDVTGTAIDGIYARNSYAGTSLTVFTGDGAVLGGQRGVYARNFGTGALSVTTGAGDVSGTTYEGIYAGNSAAGTSLTVLTGDGAVLGRHGISAYNGGTGALSVTTGAGDVTGMGGVGIFARNSSAGTNLIVLTGDGAVLGGNSGIYAGNSGTGALSVTTGAGGVTGTGFQGIYARNNNAGTSLTVLTGDGAVLGGLQGIHAYNAGTGALSVTTGAGEVTGTAFQGIDANNNNAGTSLTVLTGDGAVLGGQRGIQATNSGTGALSVTTGAGDVTGTAFQGIDANNNNAGTSLTVLTGDGAVLGGRRGILAVNSGTGALSVTTGAGDVTGTAYDGIYARNYDTSATALTVLTGDGAVLGGQRGIFARNLGTGALSVTTGAGDVTGTAFLGIDADNYGAGTSLTVLTGDGAVLGGQMGISARNFGTGALSVTTGAGDVTGTAQYGIFARNYGANTSLTVLTGDGAVLGGNMGILARQNGSGDFSITVGGLVSNTALNIAGEAVRTYGKGVTLETLAAGNITGRITTDAGAFVDIFNNGGLWISNGTSNFGGGANQINNSGTVRSANTANSAEVTSFGNAGIFTNLSGGLLTLADEAAFSGSTAHDQLTIFGNFVGGGTLAVDAFLGGPGSTADVLTIEGDITGVTQVAVNNTNAGSGAVNADGITVVTYAGTAADGAFVLANGPISAGLFAYDLEHDSGNKIFELVGTGVSTESHELATLLSAAQTIWHDTSGVLGDRFEELRGDVNGAAVVGEALVQPASYSTAASAGLWGKVLGRTSERDAFSTLSYGLDVTGFIMGVDGVVNESVAGGVLALGVTGGYVAAWQDFNSGSQADYEGFSGGVYATYVNGGFHLDSELRANFLNLDYTMVATPTSHADVTSLGGSVEAGYRIDMTDSFYLEPMARLAYVDTNIRNGDVLGVEFDGDGESFRGAVGLNLGGILNGGSDLVFKPELSVKIWNEFDGHNTATFAGFTVADDTPETFGEVGLGLEAISLSNGWSGHLNTDIQFAKDFTSYGGFVGLRKNF